MAKPFLVNDPIHGLIEVNAFQSALIECPELQRLRWIKQLSLSDIVFPGSTHSRLAHSIGTMHIAGLIANHLKFNENEICLVQAAGLLHDLGHCPYSHVLEDIPDEDHHKTTRKLITGEKTFDLPGAGKIPELLEKNNLNPKEIAKIIEGNHERQSIQCVIRGEIDADKLDYLLRDSYSSGVAHGTVGLERIISTMTLHDDSIVFKEKGLDAIESFLVARNLMFSSVYHHHTGRIADAMLLRAAQLAMPIKNFESMTDFELMNYLLSNKKSKKMTQRILYRKLFKTAFSISSRKISEEEKIQANELFRLGKEKIEQSIIQKSDLEENDVLVQLPAKDLENENIKLKELNILLERKNGELIKAIEISELAKALMKREATDSVLSIYCSEENIASALKGLQLTLEESMPTLANWVK